MRIKGKPKYKRILLKFSGEALAGNGFGIDAAIIQRIAAEIQPLLKLKVQIGIIIGGGNFFRGKIFQSAISRVTVDHMGMTATIINALAMRDLFQQNGIATEIMSAVAMPGLVTQFERHRAQQLLQENKVIIFAGGTGNPLVTTDTALSLRGIELDADLLLKATNVDGIYSSDPKKDPKAKLFHHLTYQEALAKELAVMDLAAFYLCRDHQMKLRVFNMHKSGALLRIIQGQDEGTLVEA